MFEAKVVTMETQKKGFHWIQRAVYIERVIFELAV